MPKRRPKAIPKNKPKRVVSSVLLLTLISFEIAMVLCFLRNNGIVTFLLGKCLIELKPKAAPKHLPERVINQLAEGFIGFVYFVFLNIPIKRTFFIFSEYLKFGQKRVPKCGPKSVIEHAIRLYIKRFIIMLAGVLRVVQKVSR